MLKGDTFVSLVVLILGIEDVEIGVSHYGGERKKGAMCRDLPFLFLRCLAILYRHIAKYFQAMKVCNSHSSHILCDMILS